MRLAQGVSPAGETPPDQTAPGDGTPATADAVFRLAAAGFADARETLGRLRDDIVFEDIPAPRRLAPYAAAMGAVAYRDGAFRDGALRDGASGNGASGNGASGNGAYADADDEDEIASARLVLLYDPDSQPGWPGVFRLVALVRSEVEEEMAADPLLGQVGWSWLTDALDLHVPGYAEPSGTVTRVITEGFGGKAGEPARTEFELRASWSPPDDSDLGDSVAAWVDVLAAAAGLPAQPPGTTALPLAGKHSGGKRRR